MHDDSSTADDDSSMADEEIMNDEETMLSLLFKPDDTEFLEAQALVQSSLSDEDILNDEGIMSDPILDPDDAEYLVAGGLLKPSKGGKQKMRRYLMSADKPVSRSLWNNHASLTIELPTHLENIASLEFMGYDNATAREIWEYWISFGSAEEQFIECAISHVMKMRGIEDVFELVGPNGGGRWEDGVDENFDDILNACGINQVTQNLIMGPVFDRIRPLASIEFWIIQTLKIRHDQLKDIQEFSKGRSQRRRQEWFDGAYQLL